jgi:hypothetical protein
MAPARKTPPAPAAAPARGDRISLACPPEVRDVLRARARAAAPDTEAAVGSRLLRVAVLGLTDDILGRFQEVARRSGRPVEDVLNEALRDVLGRLDRLR